MPGSTKRPSARHRPGRPGRRQRGRRIVRHLRRQQQPDPDAGGRQRGRAQPTGPAHHQRGGPARPAPAYRAAGKLARWQPWRRSFSSSPPAHRHPRDAPHPRLRRHEFTIALLTAAAVVIFGVEEGIALAVAVSIIDHLRQTSHPRSSVLVKSAAGHWQPVPVVPGARTEDGLVVYKFGTSLYYANAPRLVDDVIALADREARCSGWYSTPRRSGTSITPRQPPSPASPSISRNGTSASASAASSARCAGNSTATASTPPSARRPTTKPPVRHSKPSTQRRGNRRTDGERRAPRELRGGARVRYAVPASRVITMRGLVAAAQGCANVRGFAS